MSWPRNGVVTVGAGRPIIIPIGRLVGGEGGVESVDGVADTGTSRRRRRRRRSDRSLARCNTH